MRIVFLSAITIFILHFNAMAQGLEQFRWKNRILLLLSEEPGKEALEEQLRLFDGQENELKERKLLILSTLDQNLQVIPIAEISGLSPDKILSELKNPGVPFEILLFGLDGTVKFRGNAPILPKDLYALIDAMPMRRAELD